MPKKIESRPTPAWAILFFCAAVPALHAWPRRPPPNSGRTSEPPQALRPQPHPPSIPTVLSAEVMPSSIPAVLGRPVTLRWRGMGPPGARFDIVILKNNAMLLQPTVDIPRAGVPPGQWTFQASFGVRPGDVLSYSLAPSPGVNVSASNDQTASILISTVTRRRLGGVYAAGDAPERAVLALEETWMDHSLLGMFLGGDGEDVVEGGDVFDSSATIRWRHAGSGALAPAISVLSLDAPGVFTVRSGPFSGVTFRAVQEDVDERRLYFFLDGGPGRGELAVEAAVLTSPGGGLIGGRFRSLRDDLPAPCRGSIRTYSQGAGGSISLTLAGEDGCSFPIRLTAAPDAAHVYHGSFIAKDSSLLPSSGTLVAAQVARSDALSARAVLARFVELKDMIESRAPVQDIVARNFSPDYAHYTRTAETVLGIRAQERSAYKDVGVRFSRFRQLSSVDDPANVGMHYFAKGVGVHYREVRWGEPADHRPPEIYAEGDSAGPEKDFRFLEFDHAGTARFAGNRISASFAVGDDAAETLPRCGRKSWFSTPPLAPGDHASFSPLGHMSYPSHIFPSDHAEFYLNSAFPSSGTVAVPLVAPGRVVASEVTRTSSTAVDGTGLTWLDHSVTFFACREQKAFVGHLSSLAPPLQAAAGSFGKCEASSTGSRNVVTCRQPVHVEISEGGALGTAGGPNPEVIAVDFGAADFRAAPLPFANPARYSPALLQAACPLDFFTPSARDSILLKDARTAPPRCGEVMQDSTGTARGNWFHVGDPASQEYRHLALVSDNVDPSSGTISAGYSLPGVGRALFAATHAGAVNRDFREVKPGMGVQCYNNFLFVDGPPIPPSTAVFLRLTSPETLQVEVSTTVSCGSPFTFGPAARSYER